MRMCQALVLAARSVSSGPTDLGTQSRMARNDVVKMRTVSAETIRLQQVGAGTTRFGWSEGLGERMRQV